MNGWVLPEEVLRGAPAYTPRPRELADLELLLSGAYAPLTGFLGREDLASVTRRGRLADGTQWSAPVTLEIPIGLTEQLDLANPIRRVLVLTDAEAAPAAALDVTEAWEARAGSMYISGQLRRLGEGPRGPFRKLRLGPAEVRDQLPQGRVLGVFADRPLHRPQLAQLAHAARTIAGHVLIMIPVGGPGPDGLPPEALVRAVLAARDRLPSCTIVAVPLAKTGDDFRDALLYNRVAAAYGVTHLLSGATALTSGGLRVVLPRELAYDSRDGQWRSRDDVPPHTRRLALTNEEIADLLDRGVTLPEWHTPPAVAREVRRSRPPRRERGLVVLFTGLSGAGKSTIARGVHEALLEGGERSASLLDGDVVRRLLSKGLGFSRADRDLNIARIGYVAAEVARHGGMALCCPIAPYHSGRADARRLAHEAGAGFILVHIATPLEVCEHRDRKGLYAKARAGEITNMTGVHDPYEAPTDAEITLDTAGTVDEAVQTVLEYLTAEGWLEPGRR
ncbi:adenylyl-sulfate kinase [Longispora albida]|uniref:adenylyl-sulfate kinase n=1 Tax=Longispora albida TaxID=203523 RepID=UPI0003766E1A|nr:adenylyl-sulfate kinase [Longispora albida]